MRVLRLLIAFAVIGYIVYDKTRNPGPAPAQTGISRPASTPCVLDHCDDTSASASSASAPPAPAGPVAEAPALPSSSAADTAAFGTISPGNFDFYLLTLSWSSGFCETSAGNGKAQCEAGSNLGFVVHGLWPQFERGYPSDCDSRPAPQAALVLTRGVFPDAGLAQYEWGKHGTCSGLSPEAYFTAARRARDSITIPEEFQAAKDEQTFAPADIIRRFSDANPRLRAGMMAVGCKAGVLQEVRLCLTKDLRNFRPCPEVVQQTCRAGQVRVPPMR